LRKLNSILVTGGAGFIGSNFIRYLFTETGFEGKVINVDKLTYAGNPENLKDIEEEYASEKYVFYKNDVCDYDSIKKICDKHSVDAVVHFAAESHVDRSIFGPRDFIYTNIIGTFNLLEMVREKLSKGRKVHFHHVSTDEVYGSLENSGYFYEHTPYNPRSPYSASKASSDHLVRAYVHTYGISATISNCSNNYGPYQFPEKLIPLMILNMMEEKPLPVYGDGKNIRDWLFVKDHAAAVWCILIKGESGRTYNIGGENEWENLKLVNVLCEKMASFMNREKDYYKKLIKFVKDRPGHDKRYAINCEKIKKELGWKQSVSFSEGLDITINWYLNHRGWVERVKSGEYRKWLEVNYQKREKG